MPYININDPMQLQQARQRAKAMGWTDDMIMKQENEIQRNSMALQLMQQGYEPSKVTNDLVGLAQFANESGMQFPSVAGTASQLTKEQQRSKDQGLKGVNVLEELYGRGDASSVGGNTDLSLAGGGGLLERSGAKVAALTKKITDPKFVEDYNIYQSQLEIYKGLFTQALGAGAPTGQEGLDLLASAPGVTSSNREAKEWFKNIRRVIGDVDQEVQQVNAQKTVENLKQSQVAGQPSSGYISGDELTKALAMLEQSTPKISSKSKDDSDWLRKVALKVADASPAVGTILGGFGGGIVGSALPVVGNVALGAGGSAAGAGAGYALKQSIRAFLGEDTPDPLTQVKEQAKFAASSAAADALGFGVGKALSYTLKGANLVIKAGSNFVDEIPLKQFGLAPKEIADWTAKNKTSLSQFIGQHGYFGDDGVELLTKDIYKLQDQFDGLFKNADVKIPVNSIVDEFKTKMQELSKVKGATTLVKKYASKLTDELQNFVETYPQGSKIGADELSQLRMAVDDLIKPADWVQNSELKKLYVDLRSIYNNAIKKEVSQRMLGDGTEQTIKSLDDIGIELNKRYELSDMIKKREFKGAGGQMANIIRSMMGIGGFAVGGLPGAAVGLGADVMLRNPKVLGGMYRGGQTAANLATQAIGEPTQQAVSPLSRILMQLINQGQQTQQPDQYEQQ